MKMYTRRVDQGQMIEISYGYDCEGAAFRRTTDRSDGSVTWECGIIDWDLEPDCTDTEHVPCVEGWFECEAPRAAA